MIPPTRYIDAGPGMPLANPQVAMAQGEAMARMGNTIQQVGALGFELAGKVRRIEEAGKITALEANMNEDASQFSLELMKREDTANWPAEWKERSGKWLDEAKKQGLSPEGLARFQERFTQWNSQRSIGFETQAASKAVELSRARFGNALNYHASRNDWNSYGKTLDDARASGVISSPDHERGVMDMNAKKAQDEIKASTETNPDSILNAADADLLRQFPNSTPDMISDARRHARTVRREQDQDIINKGLDAIYGDKVNDPKELLAMAHGRPLLAQHLKNALEQYQSDGYREKLADPVNQAAAAGRARALLASYKPADAGTEDTQAIEIGIALRQLPTGGDAGAVRSELENVLKDKQAMRNTEVKTIGDAYAKALGDVQKQELDKLPSLKKPDEVMAVKKAIDDGFLRDPAKLTALGFSPDQTAAIIEGKVDGAKPKTITDEKRAEAFRKLWVSKANPQSQTADPVVAAAGLAIANRSREVFSGDPAAFQAAEAARMEATIRHGQQQIELKQYLRLNPKAGEEDIKKKVFDITGRTLHAEVGKVQKDARPENPANTFVPGETSFVLPAGLEPHRAAFVAAGDRYGVDPRVLAAISMNETGNGTSHALRVKNNAMGVSNASGPISFDTVDDSIDRMARLLGSKTTGPYANANTIADIANIYAPAGAENDPNNLNPGWYAAVSHNMRRLGMDPSEPIK